MYFLIYFISALALVPTHKPSLTSLPPLVQQDCPRFICSCLLLVKIKSPFEVLLLFKWVLNSGREILVSLKLTPMDFAWASVCACIWKSLGIPQGPKVSNTTDEGFSFLPLYIPCFSAFELVFLSFLLPHIHTYLLVISLLNSQYSYDKDRKMLFNPEALRCREVRGSKILWEVHDRTWLWAHISLC